MKLRNSIKAIIIRDHRILTIKGTDPFGDYYLLPGGGQNPAETIHEALHRECQEEINCNVIIHDLRIIREYIGKNHEFKEFDHDVHQIEFMFRCSLPENAEPRVGNMPDVNQNSVEWLDLKDLTKYRLYPQSLRDVFVNIEQNNQIYYGDLN